jgi:hypothetical protein
MARQVISKQEPWKRQILVDTQEISYVLENAEVSFLFALSCLFTAV